MVRRLQAFEFEDLPWLPGMVRDLMTDYLAAAVELLDLFSPACGILIDVLERSGCQRIVDLACGSGKVWRTLGPKLRESFPQLRVTLADAYPNLAAMEEVVSGNPRMLALEKEPVDARRVPAELEGLRTLFLAFHHFPPSAAQAILANAVERGQPIAIFEGQRRDLRHLIQFALSPIGVFLLTPWIRPFRWERLVFTYLLPIVPLLVGWDGVVSVLRTYSRDEMRALISRADPNLTFVWDVGELASGKGIVPYAYGLPRQGRSSGQA